ncbi:condensin-2 complex subunit G2-like [Glandiceps talaboti]
MEESSDEKRREILSPTRTRVEFLEAVHNDSPDDFLNRLNQHHSKDSNFDLDEFLQTLDRKQITSLWDGLYNLCNDTLISSPLAVEETDENQEELQQTVNRTVAILEGILTVALSYLHNVDNPTIPQSLEDTATILHGVLLDFPSSTKKLQNHVAMLCELWWDKDLPKKEEIINNALMFVLQQSLQKRAAADVKRMYSLRQSLLLQDFGEGKNLDLKEMLNQCMASPVYLKSDEGRRFLSFSFGMNPTFIEQLHKTIKTQLPYCPRTIVKSYAEVYFRAWRAASGPYLQKLEVHCIQDYMYCAVYASRTGSKSMASILKQLMSHFHQQKKHQAVDGMLLRLYEPIIWRALKVANGSVRANAASLLLDAFPLSDPNAENEKRDELLQKQFDALQDLLEDPCPLVRAIGVQGICNIISVFWELIPSTTVQVLLNKIVREMAYDSVSSDTRVAVFKGMSYLLKNHLCHVYLNALLPELKNCIHDNAEKVRIAFIELLLKIKGLKSMKFWHIVPMEWLLARMELDSPSVVRRLVKLVFNSFMPIDKDGAVQVNRCVSLLQLNHLAARRFYQYAHKNMPLATTVKFITCLCQTVFAWVKERQPERQDNETEEDEDSNEEKENENVLPDNSSVEVIEGMLETIAVLLAAIDGDLQKSSRAVLAMTFIAGHMPASSLPYFSRSCFSKLKRQTNDSKEEYYGILLDCLCRWGRISDVFELITDWLKAGLNTNHTEPPSATKSKRKTKKSVKFNEPVEPQPQLALAFLTRMMQKTTTRSAVLQTGKQELREVAALLKTSMQCIEQRLLGSGPLSDFVSDEFLVSALCSYCKVQLHLNSENDRADDMFTFLGEILTWADVELIPVVAKKQDVAARQPPRSASKRKGTANQNDNVTDFATDIIQNLLRISSEMVLFGKCRVEDFHQLTDFTRQLLATDYRASFLPMLTRLLYQMTQYSLILTGGEENALSECMALLLGEIVMALAKCARKQADNPANVKELFSKVSSLSDVLSHCQKYQSLSPVLRQHIMAPIVTAVVADMTNAIRKVGEAKDNVTELPTLSAFLLGIVSKTKTMTCFFVSELKQCMEAGALQTLHNYLAVVHILYTLNRGHHKIPNMKDCLLAAQLDLENMDIPQQEGEEETTQHKLHRSTLDLAKETLVAIGAVA